ncbi:MAG: bifunctional 4-hydroxy-3-methylbut-2-enyl diphosphate reductase/30S ribosomal protein S1 [Coprococcus sp.]|uniref:bifunctional 4-hydroxy-3-methylbut-2-enyl diphosphate reductase/30S ribosomal protein S1 n=1 Tax=Coprococcus catus TaxID=116085 RepID=UPI001C0389C3|nr:bifunctional 4-hydroxy-3-methylbut-2-enyl diphosphate reductase/30S ribosomal protein S1 [Coprococcus catus]MBT9773694.1 bifunctional 4-hydroxy-3-methylbut-2-enyl diphosphate reductase/30S ribosomal protein S1 [Coprococcus catus]
MRNVILAKTAGFCFGVRRAVDMAYGLAGKHKVYTYGPIIHNETVVDDLESKGVRVVHSIDEAAGLRGGTMIIRSHGASKNEINLLKQMGFEIVDATCPFVKKIHRIVEDYSGQGYGIVIIGSATHPEVQAISGWCKEPPVIIESVEEAENFSPDPDKKLCLVSQTTFNYNKFQLLVEIISKKGYDIRCLNTICNATEERQSEARDIAGHVDAMIVIGGRQSSNTQKLYDICKNECKNTYYIQTLVDLDLKTFESIGNVGITAGASTPNNIIEEVHTNMSEMGNEQSFEQMLEASLKTIRTGEVVEGTVIDVKEDEIILNIGYKADGIITRNEYSNTSNLDLRTVVNVGDTMQAKVLKVNDGEGQVLLTYKRLLAERGNKRIEEAYNNKEVLTAKVANVLEGGLSVVVEEARVFIPASLVSDTYEKNLSKYQDQEISFVITEFNPRKRRIIGDRKQLILAEKAQKQKELFEKINIGDTVEGRVKNVTDFGAFIDLGGADGLLHISEMSWGRVENPKKVLKVGDTLKVLIKDIQGEKIALSLKFPETNPWLTAAEKYAVGNVVEGKVARMTDFGAFVELEPGVDALLHVSQISRDHVDKPSDVLSYGQVITAKVVDFNEESQKISLSMKALDTKEETEE